MSLHDVTHERETETASLGVVHQGIAYSIKLFEDLSLLLRRDSDPVINATPTDAATTGNQFRLTDGATGEWHFNLDTKPLSVGTWKLTATLYASATDDGATAYVNGPLAGRPLLTAKNVVEPTT